MFNTRRSPTNNLSSARDIEYAQLSDYEAKALSKNEKVRGYVKNDLDFSLAAERKKTLNKARIFLGFSPTAEVVAIGSDLNVVKSATKKYGYAHKTADLTVSEYTLSGKWLKNYTARTGIVTGQPA